MAESVLQDQNRMSLLTCNALYIRQTVSSEICLQFILAKEMVRSNVTKGVVQVQPGASGVS